MTGDRRRPSPDRDGVRITTNRRRSLSIALLALVAVGTGWLFFRMMARAVDTPNVRTRAASQAPRKQLAGRPKLTRSPAPTRPFGAAVAAATSAVTREPTVIPPTPMPKDSSAKPPIEVDPAVAVDSGPTPEPSDYGWDGPDGIALFPRPGTNPPKPGLIVPDDFQLPPGFVRYHQTTDDGKDLAPILTFHPDYEFVDENGEPVEIPDDLVVPEEMAPAGLPIEILEVPDAVYPEGPSKEEIDRFLAEHPEVLTDGLEPEEIERRMREFQESSPSGSK